MKPPEIIREKRIKEDRAPGGCSGGAGATLRKHEGNFTPPVFLRKRQEKWET